VPYLSASAVVIHYEEALYQVYVPFTFVVPFALEIKVSMIIYLGESYLCDQSSV